ncbi:hypothetical protein ABW05_23945 [Mycolicibacterium senegalense]|uniref:Glycine-rich domain-containing protein n=2 Tax=Mycolicibacterium senegalense TaxID=1796 RepID=A0ABR5G4H0_9MYCO|nr:hypothetical protein AA982_22775 [Mycolicibacterium senegalense]KLO55101.1 hypothetical protein ABW05_23945 [Mycolicibacterium senegalense]
MAAAVNLSAGTALSLSAGFPAVAPVLSPFTASGNYTIPWWCNKIDVVVLGGGGGALNGGFTNGAGGKAGQWNAITLTRGVNIPWTQTLIAFVVGTGGTHGALAGSGAASSAAGISGSGGAGGAAFGAQPGESPGNYTFGANPNPYVGGPTATSSTIQVPGVGGYGGGLFGSGATDGGRGQVWFYAYQ